MDRSWFLAPVNGIPDYIEKEMNDQDNERLYLGWKQKRTNEARLHG